MKSYEWFSTSIINETGDPQVRQVLDAIHESRLHAYAGVGRAVDGRAWLDEACADFPAMRRHLTLALYPIDDGEPSVLKVFRPKEGWWISATLHWPTLRDQDPRIRTWTLYTQFLGHLSSPIVVKRMGTPPLYPFYAPYENVRAFERAANSGDPLLAPNSSTQT